MQVTAAPTAAAPRGGLADRVEGHRISVGQAALDCAFLALVTVLSFLVYFRHLGFYYDDYSLLARMRASGDDSLLGLYDAVRPALGQRPIAAFMFASLCWLFGLDPTGYHVVNSGLIVAVAVILYLVLRELRLPRLVAVALPLVYTMLPHYATERFWMDLVGVNASTALYLLSLYAGLRSVRASRAALVAWAAIAAAAVVVMMFTYELFAPLVLLNVALVWWVARSSPGVATRRGAAILVTSVLLGALVVSGVAKLAGVAEHGQNGYEIGLDKGLPYHIAYLVSGAVKVNLGTYFVALPYVLWWIVLNEFSVDNAAVAVLTAVVAFLYLWRIGRRDRVLFQSTDVWRALVVVGALTFVLGYAIFLTTDAVAFRSAGIDNRVNVAAALGVAAIVLGAIVWLSGRRPGARGHVAFAAATASVVGVGVFVIGTLGSYWTAAAQEQRAILRGLERHTIAPSTTVILDGVCPEIGPAVVFADESDFRNALRLERGDYSLAGDVAAEGLRADRRGLTLDMRIFDKRSVRTYPYGRGLAVYDSREGRLHAIPDRRSARAYVDSRPALGCEPQRSFAWGFDPGNRWSLL